jgi:hypothetical protein
VLCFARRGRSTGAGPAYMGLHEVGVVSRGAPLQGEAVHIPFCLDILISVWSIDLENSNLSTHYPILFYSSFWSLTWSS